MWKSSKYSWTRGWSKIASLPHFYGSGKHCVHSPSPDPILLKYTGYVTMLLLFVFVEFKSWILWIFAFCFLQVIYSCRFFAILAVWGSLIGSFICFIKVLFWHMDRRGKARIFSLWVLDYVYWVLNMLFIHIKWVS